MSQEPSDLDIRHHAIRGCELRDRNGVRIGVVEDVIFDEQSQVPTVLVVHPEGWVHKILHDDRYVPASHGHLEGDVIVTDFDKDEVLHAPIAPHHNHVVDGTVEHEIAEHYRLE